METSTVVSDFWGSSFWKIRNFVLKKRLSLIKVSVYTQKIWQTVQNYRKISSSVKKFEKIKKNFSTIFDQISAIFRPIGHIRRLPPKPLFSGFLALLAHFGRLYEHFSPWYCYQKGFQVTPLGFCFLAISNFIVLWFVPGFLLVWVVGAFWVSCMIIRV